MVLSGLTVTTSAEETKDLGAKFGSDFLNTRIQNGAHLICLWGDLGSGKTTFIQGIARGVGVSRRIVSPTFVIMRRYEILKTPRNLYHFDLYRLHTKDDVESIGFFDALEESDALLCVEWPERLGKRLPNNRIDIYFSTLNNGSHEITMKKV